MVADGEGASEWVGTAIALCTCCNNAAYVLP
jgi:hypothetical protein